MENFVYKGYWWLPFNKEKLSPGVLRYTSNNTGTLEIICNDVKNWQNDDREIKIVLGLADNTYFTLCNCEIIRDSFLSNPHIMTLSVQFIVKGEHYTNQDSIKIKNAKIEFDYLNYWSDAEYFEFRFKKNNFLKKQPITLLPVKRYKITIDSNFILHIIVTNNINNPPGIPEINIRKKVHFEMQFINEVKISDFYLYLDQLNKFYCFSIQCAAHPISILANKSKSNYKLEINIKKKFSKSTNKDKIQRSDMLFMFDDIESVMTNIIPNWFNSFNVLKSIYTLYFGDLLGDQFLQAKFLTMIQVIESFHRTFFPKAKPKIPKDEFKKRKKLILSLIPSKDIEIYKEWLNTSLINSPSLKQRLEHLFEKYDFVLKNYGNINEFIEVTVNTRNAMSHALSKDERDEAKYPIAKDYRNLYNLYLKTKLIVDLCFLDNLELKETLILKYLGNYWKYDSILKGEDYFKTFGLISKNE